LNGLNLSGSHSKLLAIVANERGARDAARFDQIHYLGFPLSISETFQQRNTNRSVSEALDTVSSIQEICEAAGKEQVVYISMGFGNPYGDPYDEGIVEQFADILITLGIRILSLADTIGLAQPDQIRKLFTTLIHRFPSVEFGAHLHSNPLKSEEKLEAAYGAGCHRFDGALKGYGGCPMAKDELVGNLATERIISFLEWRNDAPPLNKQALAEALILSQTVFQQASLQRK
jgi:hydroxymethylglutaryl-CoA lyase